jgi:hypothetical protein
MIHFQIMARALAILLHLAPVTRAYEALPGWSETPVERLHRYYAIAADVSSVAIEVCHGNRACAMGAVTSALGIAWHESAFAPDVDLGPCYRGKDGKGPRCDGGNAHSMWQLHPLSCVTGPHAPKNPDGTLKKCDEAVLYDTDRRAAAREAIRRIWRSKRACARAGVPPEEQLAIYAKGGCKLSGAAAISRELTAYIRKAAASPDLPAAPLPLPPPTPTMTLPTEIATK